MNLPLPIQALLNVVGLGNDNPNDPSQPHPVRDKFTALLLGGREGLASEYQAQREEAKRRQTTSTLMAEIMAGLNPPDTMVMPARDTAGVAPPQPIVTQSKLPNAMPMAARPDLSVTRTGLPTMEKSAPDMDRVYTALLKARADGVPVGDYASLVGGIQSERDRKGLEDELTPFSPELAALSRVAPAAAAAEGYKLRHPETHFFPDQDGNILAISQDANGGYKQSTLQGGPTRAKTQTQLTAEILAKVAQGGTLSKGERQVYDDVIVRGSGDPTLSQLKADILGKMQRGEKLKPGEQQIYDDILKHQANPFADLLANALTGAAGGAGGAAPGGGGGQPPGAKPVTRYVRDKNGRLVPAG